MRISRRALVAFSLFVLLMAVWYLAGYPQLANETPVFLYDNFLGIPVEYVFSTERVLQVISVHVSRQPAENCDFSPSTGNLRILALQIRSGELRNEEMTAIESSSRTMLE